MTLKKKKKLIIIISIVIIVIAIVSLILLYVTTDFLKSNQTLFFKYVSQNADAAIELLDNTSEKEYTKMLQQNKYELNSELTAEYIQNANTTEENKSNNINKLKLQVSGQSDYQSSYDYRNAKILYDSDAIFEVEGIHDGNIYGVKFTDMFNQYLSIENNNLKELAEKCGLTQEQINSIPNTIEEIDLNALFSLTNEQTTQLQNTYLNILLNNISPESYSKQKNALITVNGSSITTNAYILKLTQEQANNIYISVLEQLKNDEIILGKITEICETLLISDIDAIKENYTNAIDEKITNIKDNNIGTNQITYTVYQIKGQTVRTTIENAEQKIVVDLNKNAETTEVNIEKSIASESEENKFAIKIIKNNSASKDEFSIEYQNTLGDMNSNGKVYRNKTASGSTINVETGIKYSDSNDNQSTAKYIKDINFVSEIERAVVLEEKKNNVTLNNYSVEQVTDMLNLAKEKLTENKEANRQLIDSIIPQKENGETNTNIQENGQISEIEKNRFNSKFEFYTGAELSSEDISKLLDVVKDNLEGAQVSYREDQTSNSTKKLQSIRLKIEKDKQNKELADSIKDLIETNRKYTVTIQYDENTNIVSYIIIEVNE